MSSWLTVVGAGAVLTNSLLAVAGRCCLDRPPSPGRWRRLVVVTTGSAVFSTVAALRTSGATAVMVLVFCVLFVVSLVDVEELRVPNKIIWPACWASAAVGAGALLTGHEGGRSGLLAALWLTAVIGACHAVRPGGMGLGDVKLAAFVGFVVGFPAASPVVAVQLVGWTLVLAAAFGFVTAAVRRSPSPLPFAPSLCMAAWGVSMAAQLVIR